MCNYICTVIHFNISFKTNVTFVSEFYDWFTYSEGVGWLGLCLGLTLLLKQHCPWWHSLYQYTAWCDMLQMVRFLFCLALLSFCIGKYQLKAELHGRNVSLTWRDFKPPDYKFEYSVAISTSLTTTTWKKVEVRLFKKRKERMI